MITNIQKEFIAKIKSGELTKRDIGYKYYNIMLRVQEQIDKNMANLIWLIENYNPSEDAGANACRRKNRNR